MGSLIWKLCGWLVVSQPADDQKQDIGLSPGHMDSVYLLQEIIPN